MLEKHSRLNDWSFGLPLKRAFGMDKDDGDDQSLALGPDGGDVTGLQSLPMEIIRDIARHCRPEAAASLSASCRSLQAMIGGETREKLILDTSGSARRAFLSLILDQDPELLYCFTCKKSYEWKRALSYPRYCCPARPTVPHSGPLLVCNGGTGIYKEIRDLVLRFYIRGETFGLPLSYIHHRQCYGPMLGGTKWDVQTQVHAKIVGSSLLIHRVDSTTIQLWSRSYPQLWKFLDRPCPHLGMHVPAMGVCLVHHVEINRVSDFFHRREISGYDCQKLQRCKDCAMDFRFSIDAQRQPPLSMESRHKERCIVQIDSYFNLGSRYLVPGSLQAAHFPGYSSWAGAESSAAIRFRDLEHSYDRRTLALGSSPVVPTNSVYGYSWTYGVKEPNWTEGRYEGGASFGANRDLRSDAWRITSLTDLLSSRTFGSGCELKKRMAEPTVSRRLLGLSKQVNIKEPKALDCWECDWEQNRR